MGNWLRELNDRQIAGWAEQIVNCGSYLDQTEVRALLREMARRLRAADGPAHYSVRHTISVDCTAASFNPTEPAA